MHRPPSIEIGRLRRSSTGAPWAGYLDHNATTPVRPEARDAAIAALTSMGNPSSVHRFGREAQERMEHARERVAALAEVDPGQVVFTSGGTEANILALQGSGRSRILASEVEHASILGARDAIERIPVDPTGIVDLAALEAMLTADGAPTLVSVMLANNETGVLQPVREVAALARRYGAEVHCDAIQAAGKIPVSIADLGVDMISLSAHKIGGPAGVGALIIGNEAIISSHRGRGGQERGVRPGTQNLSGIVGFGKAAELAADDVARSHRLATWRDALEQEVLTIAPDAQVFGRSVPRLTNTSCFTMPGVLSDVQVMTLDLAGIAVSAGAACSSGKVGSSHVLAAMGVPDRVARTAIRVSLGWTTTSTDIDDFLATWARLYHRKGQGRRPLSAGSPPGGGGFNARETSGWLA